MSRRPPPEAIVVLLLVLASVVAACETKPQAQAKVDVSRARNVLQPVIPALGIRG